MCAHVGGIRSLTLDSYRRARLVGTRREARKQLREELTRFLKGGPTIAARPNLFKAPDDLLPQYLDLSPLGSDSQRLKGYEVLVEEYMRFYSFFGNLVVAIPLALLIRIGTSKSPVASLAALGWTGACIVTCTVAISGLCARRYWIFYRRPRCRSCVVGLRRHAADFLPIGSMSRDDLQVRKICSRRARSG